MEMRMEMQQEPERKLNAHTPAPWAVHDRAECGGKCGFSHNRTVVVHRDYAVEVADCGTLSTLARSNAELIVRAVNNHDALVAALGYVAEVIPAADYRKSDDSDQIQITVTVGWLREVAAALSAAQE